MTFRRFWFEFDLRLDDPYPPGVLAGCGVTAYDLEDAISLLKQRVFTSGDLPGIRSIVEDVDVSTLDAGHVLPNMGAPVWRGVWFPLGYQA
jgi:hypothetical protein